MHALTVLGASLGLVLPVVALLLLMRRQRKLVNQAPLLVAAAAAGVVAAVVAAVIERIVLRAAELDGAIRTGSLTLLLYTFAVAAPLEMALTVAAAAPFWRLRRVRRSERWPERPSEHDGMAFAAAAAAGQATMRHALFVWRSHAPLDVVRCVVAGFGFTLLASLWGYALGRDPDRGLRARKLARVWLGSAVFLAVQDELLFHRGRQAVWASLPLLACTVGAAVFLWRDPLPVAETSSSGRLSLLFTAPAPSIGAIRDAFREEDRPLALRWLSFGALVNTGVVLTGIVLAVAVGRRFGVDFAAVERSDAARQAIAPVLLLGVGALAAFPVAGYLIARASGARSVLEPALSSALALVGLLVFFGLLAPAALVFVMAITPVAFGLSCAGAWFGLAR